MSTLHKTFAQISSTGLLFVLPLAASAKSFKDLVNNDIVPLGDKLIALLYAVAFLIFLFGMVRLFFSSDAESRQKGKLFAIWGIVALAALFAVWGIVQFLLSILGSFNT